jgi:uncharacterized protein YndB with AHSA1/START domain
MPIDKDTRKVWAVREIDAPAADIFSIVADPTRHQEIDGSGTVREATGEPRQLKLGDKFNMKMKWGVPYAIRSKVVEFDQDRLIAWAHPGGHRWRYEFEPLDDNRTRVTETFDYATAYTPWAYEWVNIPDGHEDSIERTLERLEAVVTE